MDPRAIAELFRLEGTGAPLNAAVTEDRFLVLSESGQNRCQTCCSPAASRTTATM